MDKKMNNNKPFAAIEKVNLFKAMDKKDLIRKEWTGITSLSEIDEFKEYPWTDPLYKTIDLYLMGLLGYWADELPLRYNDKKRRDAFKIWNTYSNRFDDEWNSLRKRLNLFNGNRDLDNPYDMDWNTWYTIKAKFKNGILFWMINNNLVTDPFNK